MIQKTADIYLYRESAMKERTRKNMDMDAEKLSKVKALLGARSETEAVDLALDYVLSFEREFNALDRLADLGGLDDVFGSPAPRVGRVAER